MDERMAMMRDDPAVDLTVDGNAIAGLLMTVFEREVTMVEERCVHCGTVSMVGTLRVYLRGPGVVVRCPACAEVVLRIVETPTGVRVDLSGATHLAVTRGPGA
jgi:ribosomal protein S27E